MPNKHHPSLLLTLKSSVRLTHFINTAHLFALIACLSNPLPVIYKSAVILALAINYRLTVNRLEKTQYVLKFNAVSGWEIADGQGFVSVKILPSTVISIYAIFLHLEILVNDKHIPRIAHKPIPTKRKTLLIVADSLNAEDYRNLTVKLKTTWDSKANLAAS